MESLGYAQTKDSRIEGTLADMIFVPPADRRWPREIWVEAKAHKLSLADPTFRDEICRYLQAWLSLDRNSRFKLMVFATGLRLLSKWQELWDKDLSRETVLAWISSSELGKQLCSKYSMKLIISFFSETEIYDVNESGLQSGVEERTRTGIASMAIRRSASEAAVLMERRARPVPKKSKLIANLINFEPPHSYTVLEIPSVSRVELRNRLQGTEFPYAYPTDGTVITLDVPGALQQFQIFNPKERGKIDIIDVTKAYPRGFSELVNNAVDRKLDSDVQRIAKWDQGWRYFLADEEAERNEPRILRIQSRRKLQVARPFFTQAAIDTGAKKLNFVFHWAFRTHYLRLWGEHYVVLEVRRLYTHDGRVPVDGKSMARIDRGFRKSKFNRGESHQARMTKLALYLFSPERLGEHPWLGQFRFGEPLKIATDWTPDAVDVEQKFISDYEEEESLDD